MSQADRDELKRQLLWDDEGSENYVDFEARCVRKFGPAAGIFLRQLLYWTGKEHDPEGWIYKTQAQMEEETGLSIHWQRKARKILGSKGAIEEVKRGIPCKLWYRVNLEALLRIMETPYSTLNQSKRKTTADDSLNQNYSEAGITNHRREFPITMTASEGDIMDPASEVSTTEPAAEDRSTVPAITEITSDNTPEILTKNTAQISFLQNGEKPASDDSSQRRDGNKANTSTDLVCGSERQKIFRLLTDIETDTHRVYRRYREGSLTFTDVVNALCYGLTGSYEVTERYAMPVESVLADLEKNLEKKGEKGRRHVASR